MLTNTQKSLNNVFNIDDRVMEDQDSVECQLVTTEDNQYDNLPVVTNNDQYEDEDDDIKRSVQDDYTQARDNLKNLLQKSEKLYDLASQIAEATENPKHLDVAAKLLNQMADINTRLVDLTAKKQDVYIKTRPKSLNKFAQAIDGSVPVNNVTNNTLFVGSSAELAKMLNDIKKQEHNT